MGGRIAFDALKNRGELAALDAAFLYRAGTPVAKVLLGTPAVLATLTNREGFGHCLTPYPSTGRMLGQWRLQGHWRHRAGRS